MQEENELLETVNKELEIMESKMHKWLEAIKTEIYRSEHCRYLIIHHLNKDKFKETD